MLPLPPRERASADAQMVRLGIVRSGRLTLALRDARIPGGGGRDHGSGRRGTRLCLVHRPTYV
jgi:hypothetical protein